jgi:hypothetical protein
VTRGGRPRRDVAGDVSTTLVSLTSSAIVTSSTSLPLAFEWPFVEFPFLSRESAASAQVEFRAQIFLAEGSSELPFPFVAAIGEWAIERLRFNLLQERGS